MPFPLKLREMVERENLGYWKQMIPLDIGGCTATKQWTKIVLMLIKK